MQYDYGETHLWRAEYAAVGGQKWSGKRLLRPLGAATTAAFTAYMLSQCCSAEPFRVVEHAEFALGVRRFRRASFLHHSDDGGEAHVEGDHDGGVQRGEIQYHYRVVVELAFRLHDEGDDPR